MIEVEVGVDQLVEDGERLAVDHRAALLQHHVPLRRHLGVHQLEVAHAVGFHAHRRLQVLLGKALEIVGRVVRGHRVVAPAQARHRGASSPDLSFFVDLNIRCSRKCATPDWPGDVVGAADAIPHHVRDDRRAAVGDDNDLHAVGERELAGAALRRGIERGSEATAKAVASSAVKPVRQSPANVLMPAFANPGIARILCARLPPHR